MNSNLSQIISEGGQTDSYGYSEYKAYVSMLNNALPKEEYNERHNILDSREEDLYKSLF